ncbi:MAG: AMP-binding protein [Nitrospirae bacterium]|nr:AMP-binding protein [Nitrospirota bacterium]
MLVWNAINNFAEDAPHSVALRQADGEGLTYRELRGAIITTASRLAPFSQGERVGLLIGSNPLWCVYDIALTLKGCIVVPIPEFFSYSQMMHIVRDSGIKKAVVEGSIAPLIKDELIIHKTASLHEIKKQLTHRTAMPTVREGDVIKITYTSGTTGAPKGVMITMQGVDAVLSSLKDAVNVRQGEKYLSILPLSVLLENIAGLYLPIMCGAEVIYHAECSLNMSGKNLYRILNEVKPTALLLVPEILENLIRSWRLERRIAEPLNFIACGGAVVSAETIKTAHRLGLPVYEGYGLSECTSVVSVNTAKEMKIGSVGRPLPHLNVTIADDGEIMVSGSSIMAGYTGGGCGGSGVWHTGDVGYIDEDGFLYVTGRKKDVIITSTGRNISPEWIEAELKRAWGVRQSFVFGEAMPHVSALIYVDKDRRDITSLKNSLSKIEKGLPGYARPKRIYLIEKPFNPADGTITMSGRLNRQKIMKLYKKEIEFMGSKHVECH